MAPRACTIGDGSPIAATVADVPGTGAAYGDHRTSADARLFRSLHAPFRMFAGDTYPRWCRRELAPYPCWSGGQPSVGRPPRGVPPHTVTPAAQCHLSVQQTPA